MKHSLRDLQASGGTVLVIMGTSTLQEHEWITVPILVIANKDMLELAPIPRTFTLVCRKEMLSEATALWPEAVVVAPDNTWLIAAQ